MAGPHLIEREQWAEEPDVWQGFEGGAYGAGVSVMFFTTDRIGGGPKLHRHPRPSSFAKGGRCFPSATGRSRRVPGRLSLHRQICRTSSSISVPDGWRQRTSM